MVKLKLWIIKPINISMFQINTVVFFIFWNDYKHRFTNYTYLCPVEKYFKKNCPTERNRGEKNCPIGRNSKIAQNIILGWNDGVEDDKVIRCSLRPRISVQTGNYRFFGNGRQISWIFEIKPSLSDSLSPEKKTSSLLTYHFQFQQRKPIFFYF